MSGDHGHDHGAAAMRAGARHMRPLLISFGLIVAFLVVQVFTGIVTGSLALLSDAGHMATDALGLGMALAAIQAASKARVHPRRTFGLYRLEILAALVNAVLLFGVAGYVLFEAVRRLSDAPDVASTPVLIVGILGLIVNVIAFLLLRAGSKESLMKTASSQSHSRRQVLPNPALKRNANSVPRRPSSAGPAGPFCACWPARHAIGIRLALR